MNESKFYEPALYAWNICLSGIPKMLRKRSFHDCLLETITKRIRFQAADILTITESFKKLFFAYR